MTDIEAEREMSRTDVAEYLRTFADELDPNTVTRPDPKSEAPDEREGEHQQHDETQSADDEKTSDESGILDSLADDEHEEAEDQQDHSDQSDELSQPHRKVTFMVGNESTTINPPEAVTFEMAVDSESSLIRAETGRTARFALHWNEEDAADDDEFSVR